MSERLRLYTAVLQDHLQRHRQMALISGPRQVGKTTVCRSLSDAYFNWDNADDRRRLLRGPTHTRQPKFFLKSGAIPFF